MFDDEFLANDFEYIDLSNEAETEQPKLEYSKARQGSRFHPSKDRIDFVNY